MSLDTTTNSLVAHQLEAANEYKLSEPNETDDTVLSSSSLSLRAPLSPPPSPSPRTNENIDEPDKEAAVVFSSASPVREAVVDKRDQESTAVLSSIQSPPQAGKPDEEAASTATAPASIPNSLALTLTNDGTPRDVSKHIISGQEPCFL